MRRAKLFLLNFQSWPRGGWAALCARHRGDFSLGSHGLHILPRSGGQALMHFDRGRTEGVILHDVLFVEVDDQGIPVAAGI